jgi:hypothetical protein
MGYNLRENEIIVIQSLLTKEYFDGLIPININKYIKYNTYDNVEPKISQVYDNNFEINNKTLSADDSKLEDANANACLPKKINISSKIWKDSFPPKFKEMHYKDDNCGFRLISDIIKNFSKNTITINKNDLKTELLEEYSKYYEKYREQILDILIIEGKKTQGSRVKKNTLSFQNFIYSDDYFITNLDIWIMMNRYKIPCILIASKHIILTNRTKQELVLYGKRDDNFVFIYSPAMRNERIAKYSIIVSPEEIMENSLDVIRDENKKDAIIESIESNFTLEKMLQSFTKKMVGLSKPVKGQKLGKIIIDDDESIKKLTPDNQTKKQKTTVIINKKTKKQKPNLVIEE